MVRRCVSTLLAFFLFSCAHESKVLDKQKEAVDKKEHEVSHNVYVKKRLHVDASFTAEELRIIKWAAQEWTSATDGIVQYDVITDFTLDTNKAPPNKIMLIKIKTLDPLVKLWKIDEDLISGISSIPGSTVLIFMTDRIFSKETFKSHVLRSLGMELGVSTYSGVTSGVMNQEMNVTCLTEFDMALFCTKYACLWKEMNYCVDDQKKTKNKSRKI